MSETPKANEAPKTTHPNVRLQQLLRKTEPYRHNIAAQSGGAALGLLAGAIIVSVTGTPPDVLVGLLIFAGGCIAAWCMHSEQQRAESWAYTLATRVLQAEEQLANRERNDIATVTSAAARVIAAASHGLTRISADEPTVIEFYGTRAQLRGPPSDTVAWAIAMAEIFRDKELRRRLQSHDKFVDIFARMAEDEEDGKGVLVHLLQASRDINRLCTANDGTSGDAREEIRKGRRLLDLGILKLVHELHNSGMLPVVVLRQMLIDHASPGAFRDTFKNSKEARDMINNMPDATLRQCIEDFARWMESTEPEAATR